MVLCIEQDDKSWQIHLDGLLTVLRCDRKIESQPTSMLAAVLWSERHDSPANNFSSPMFSSPLGRAALILNTIMISLKEQFHNMTDTTQDLTSWRHLDLVKLRSEIKPMYRNLDTVAALLSTASGTDGVPTTADRRSSHSGKQPLVASHIFHLLQH